MKTLNLGIVMDQGADFSLVIGICGDAGPINLTGYSFQSQMKISSSECVDSSATFDFEILNQVTNKGQVRWYLPRQQVDEVVTSITTALEGQRRTTPFIFDIKMTDLSSNVTRIIQGIIQVSPQATQECSS